MDFSEQKDFEINTASLREIESFQEIFLTGQKILVQKKMT